MGASFLMSICLHLFVSISFHFLALLSTSSMKGLFDIAKAFAVSSFGLDVCIQVTEPMNISGEREKERVRKKHRRILSKLFTANKY